MTGELKSNTEFITVKSAATCDFGTVAGDDTVKTAACSPGAGPELYVSHNAYPGQQLSLTYSVTIWDYKTYELTIDVPVE